MKPLRIYVNLDDTKPSIMGSSIDLTQFTTRTSFLSTFIHNINSETSTYSRNFNSDSCDVISVIDELIVIKEMDINGETQIIKYNYLGTIYSDESYQELMLVYLI